MIKKELKKEDYFSLFDQIKDDILWIDFTGGEPFLREDIDDIVCYAYNQTSMEMCDIITNGILSKLIVRKIENILEKVPRYKLLTVGVSIDSRSKYEEIRGIDGFERALRCFLKLRELQSEHDNLTSHIVYTISEYNAGDFPGFFEYMSDNYGVSMDDISIGIEHFSPYFHRRETRSVADRYKAYKEKASDDIRYAASLYKRRRFPVFEAVNSAFNSFYLRNVPRFLEKPERRIIECTACKCSVYVDPYGYVHPCLMWDVRVGHMREGGLRAIVSSKRADRFRRMIRDGKCPNCWATCEARPSFVSNPGVLIREMTKTLLRGS